MGLFSESLESAFSFFMAPVNYVKDSLSGAAQWCWEVIQGDFNEEQTTAQIATSTVISMIPFVDQICDVRDIIANCKKINEDTSDTFAWIALVFTLIGLVPFLGSLFKGCLKILFAPVRRLFMKVGRKMSPSQLSEMIESGVKQLIDYLDMPIVQKALKKLNIHNPLKEVAKQLDQLKSSLNTGDLCKLLDELLDVVKAILDKIKPYLPKKIIKKCDALWDMLLDMKTLSNQQITNALAPIEELLERFINRLHHESDDIFRANVGANFHGINRIPDHIVISRSTELPSYYREFGEKYFEINKLGGEHSILIAQGYPDITKNAKGPLNNTYKTFSTLNAVELPPGTVLVRVVDPKSVDNSTCWMRLEEFNKLRSRDQWREQFAVKTHWNSNGEYITYTVPDGQPLKVWEGRAASQQITKQETRIVNGVEEQHEIDLGYFIPGGGMQIVVDPSQLNRLYISGRKQTNWHYGEVEYVDSGITFIGVPDLTQNVGNWYK